jgi:hypothetical protein
MSEANEQAESGSGPIDGYVPWPDDGGCLSFEMIADWICDAIRFAYTLERQNEAKDIPWGGPNIGTRERSTCHQPKEQLSAEMLAFALEDQGRDALDEIVGLALRLGIEQGRRIDRDSVERRMRAIQIKLHEQMPRAFEGT